MKTLKQSDLKQVRCQVISGVAHRVDSKVWQVNSQMRTQVENQVYSQVRFQVRNQVVNQVNNQIYENIKTI